MQEAALGLHLERQVSREGDGREDVVDRKTWGQDRAGQARQDQWVWPRRARGQEQPQIRLPEVWGSAVDDQAAELQVQASPPSSSGAQ